VLDEPTNHLDLEAIEALVQALRAFDGTLILVSHDRWFVSKLATRVVEISRGGIRDFKGSYEQFVHASGDDHLDVDTVVLKAQQKKRKAKRETRDGGTNGSGPGEQTRALERRRDEVTSSITGVEARIAEIDEKFFDPGFYDATPRDEVKSLEERRARLQSELDGLLAEWESVEAELAEAAG
jgi:ATPase subunit of ABC transporter with duplicated ATPase domains